MVLAYPYWLFALVLIPAIVAMEAWAHRVDTRRTGQPDGRAAAIGAVERGRGFGPG